MFTTLLKNETMTNQDLTHKSTELDFNKEYDKLMDEGNKVSKITYPAAPTNFNVEESFKKFSLYTECFESTTSFNTNAVL